MHTVPEAFRGLQTVDFDPQSDYMAKKLPPVVAAVVIGVLVMVAYLLFILVSCCCMCCSSKRGFCQRPQQATYFQRLPFVVLVCLPAVVGIIGAIMVMAGGPGLVAAVKDLTKALLGQVPNRVPSIYLQQRCGVQKGGNWLLLCSLILSWYN